MHYFAETIRLSDRWSHNTRFTVSSNGTIESIETDTSPGEAEKILGIVIPGMPNVHSHAFQRAMAGLTENISVRGDDFWNWRNMMYSYANKITPEQMFTIAAHLYMEMLKAGYTSVAEFHYIHHDRDGKQYSNPTLLADSISEAAEYVGIGLTLLPTLYQSSNFGDVRPSNEQRRFINNTDQFLNIVDNLSRKKTPQRQIGVALHSLRAVPSESISQVISLKKQLGISTPLHIHISEQVKEIADCIKYRNSRPVQWLHNYVEIDSSWCLIHSTHLDKNELNLLANSGCVVGLCPTTEANLGDGIFPAKRFMDKGGNIAIGSDSHICVDPTEELRWLEYSQRLTHLKRNQLAQSNTPHTGTFLWESAIKGGAKACGRNIDGIRVNNSADLIVLDDAHTIFAGKDSETYLDTFVFASNSKIVKDVMVAGHWVVKNGKHALESTLNQNFSNTIKSLVKPN